MVYDFSFVSPQLRNIIEPATLHSHKMDRTLGCRVFKNAIVAPYIDWDKSVGCVIDESGKVVKESEYYEWRESESFYKMGSHYCEHKKAIFIGFILTVFGHTFTDNFRKLWFLNTSECARLLNGGAVLVYTTNYNQTLPAIAFQMCELAGYDIMQALHITELTQFDEVYIPDNCFTASNFGRLYNNAYVDIINRIKSNVPSGKVLGDKIYFSRTKFSGVSKREYGEKALERVFKKKGYTIIYPEDYSIIEQIQMVRQCEAFASTEGSVAHLSLFCKSGTHVTIINKANYLNCHQVTINEIADLNVTYVEAHHSIKAEKEHPWWGPFYLCVNKYLEHYVGHRVVHLPYWLRPSYWAYSRCILYRCYNRIRKLFQCAL